jgi:hypothetical protein
MAHRLQSSLWLAAEPDTQRREVSKVKQSRSRQLTLDQPQATYKANLYTSNCERLQLVYLYLSGTVDEA